VVELEIEVDRLWEAWVGVSGREDKGADERQLARKALTRAGISR
jgi:hypothetical protein